LVGHSKSRRRVIRIGVLADTHVGLLEDIPKKIIDSLSTVDLIVHAGDFTTREVLNRLNQLAEVKAVQGNMDSSELRTALPVKEILEIENKRIGITHGSGSHWGIEDRAKRIFEQDQVDVIIYGHSHQAQNKVSDNIIFFNPGKATNSFGILTIEEEVRGEIISSKS